MIVVIACIVICGGLSMESGTTDTSTFDLMKGFLQVILHSLLVVVMMEWV
jgi:hypothetical protein